ncbi:MAG: hypothetical protein N2444_00275 [Methylocystis sp.]|nr:hypothetical protein [Methylocystis sp.]
MRAAGVGSERTRSTRGRIAAVGGSGALGPQLASKIVSVAGRLWKIRASVRRVGDGFLRFAGCAGDGGGFMGGGPVPILCRLAARRNEPIRHGGEDRRKGAEERGQPSRDHSFFATAGVTVAVK